MRNQDINLFGFIVGAIGVGYAIYTTNKMNKLCNKIDKSLEDMADSVELDIPESLVRKAINNSVDREVNRAVTTVANQAVREIKTDMHNQIKREVDAAYSDIRKDVVEKVASEVSNIDMNRLSRDITKRAEDKIIDKFDGNLDDILGKFNRELNSISTIYNSIANTMSNHGGDKGTFLKIS